MHQSIGMVYDRDEGIYWASHSKEYKYGSKETLRGTLNVCRRCNKYIGSDYGFDCGEFYEYSRLIVNAILIKINDSLTISSYILLNQFIKLIKNLSHELPSMNQ